MRCVAEIEFECSPETKEHAQTILDNWTQFNPLKITVLTVDNSESDT